MAIKVTEIEAVRSSIKIQARNIPAKVKDQNTLVLPNEAQQEQGPQTEQQLQGKN